MSDDLVAVFQEELRDLLESLERGLIDLQESPNDAGLVNQVFRDLHTVKGSGAMFGFTDLAAFIHDFETAFEKVRAGDVPVTPELVRLGLAARDQITGLVEGTPDPNGERPAILAQLRQLTSGTVVVDEPEEKPVEKPVAKAGPRGPSRLRFRLANEAIALGARPDLVLNELRELGATEVEADITQFPPLTHMNVDECHIGWSMMLPASVEREQVDDVFMFVEADWVLETDEPEEIVADEDDGFDFDMTDVDIAPAAAADETPEADEGTVYDVTPDAAPVAAAPAPAPKPAAAPVATPVPVPAKSVETAKAASAEPAATVRVPAARLDNLMDSVGELVTVEARLTELARQSRDTALLATAEEITRLATRLRDATMTMRMVPMRTLVSRFRRLIMSLSDDLGKPVEFVVEGEETELDKTVIEKLADPLVHILRNAIDHGMERPDQRVAAGKEASGRIELSAAHAGGEVLIRVTDNGRGMDPERIRAKAIERGIIQSDVQLSDSQIYALVLEAGFSTAETVTELSGRGVGMDVVRRTIENLRGAIDIDSKLGKGTTVTLRLPLTLAIVDGLLIEVAGERYTLPMAAVKEIFELPADKKAASRSGDYLDIRGQFVPFVRLRTLFECDGTPPKEQNVVVVEASANRLGIVVDRIIGTNQTVIKQVSKLQRAARTISGATILGDGTVSLIIDVPQLFAAASPLGENRKEAAA